MKHAAARVGSVHAAARDAWSAADRAPRDEEKVSNTGIPVMKFRNSVGMENENIRRGAKLEKPEPNSKLEKPEPYSKLEKPETYSKLAKPDFSSTRISPPGAGADPPSSRVKPVSYRTESNHDSRLEPPMRFRNEEQTSGAKVNGALTPGSKVKVVETQGSKENRVTTSNFKRNGAQTPEIKRREYETPVFRRNRADTQGSGRNGASRLGGSWTPPRTFGAADR